MTVPPHVNHSIPDQAQAERNMALAGVAPPKPCKCENPHTYRDEDFGHRRCHTCGRAVK